MKQRIYILIFSLVFTFQAFAQRNCGQQAYLQHLEENYPGTIEKVKNERAKALVRAAEFSKAKSAYATAKTTSTVYIPVVFHIVLDTNQFNSIGGKAGIENRITSQLKVLNEDYNAANPDQTKIPAVWAPLFANMGITFGLAHVDPFGGYTDGYTIKIVPATSSFDASDGAKGAKFSASGGTDCWDNTRYLNIWIVNLKTSGTTALGVTAPPGFSEFTKPELGIALNCYAFGARTSTGQTFINKFDKGRTLSHEMGHYFYLFHTWGDDSGSCTGDDGFSDTPLESDAQTGVPVYPKFDACTGTGDGVMFMNYMDYCDDVAMYMFTKQQEAMVKSEIAPGGQSFSLTQNPGLIDPTFKLPFAVKIFPIPSSGVIHFQYDDSANPLHRIVILNVMGQQVIESTEANIKSIDLSNLAKGIYFAHCHFNNEILIQKIILQ